MLKRYHDTTDAATGFDLLPAIDLRGGRVVRLREGDFGRETAYGADPAAVAQRFAREGARWLHIVDLDGARAGEPRQLVAITEIIERVGRGVRCEVAGGLRTEAAVERALSAGAWRAVVGTAALRDPSFAATLVRRHGADRIAVAIDVRDGHALGDAWLEGAPGIPVADAVLRLADAGVTTFEVTAIARDGQLGGPDLELLRTVVDLRCGAVIASGGISRLEDLDAVRAIGCRGAIIGRALYEGRLTVSEAVARTGSGPGTGEPGARPPEPR